jgi:sulfur relay (sulfurtransferase) DsrF/TusC family protein
MPKVLSIVGTAYRATIEEQDDTILWLTSMCSGAGLDVSLLLRDNAVNYAVRGQDASGLRFGSAELANPPAIDRDLEDLIAKGVSVRYVAEDLAERGVRESRLIEGAKPVTRSELPGLFAQFGQVWNW